MLKTHSPTEGQEAEIIHNLVRSSSRGLCPVAAVEGAVLDGLGDVGFAAEVGDGAGDLEDVIVGAGGEDPEEFRQRAGCEIISKQNQNRETPVISG